MAIVRLELSDLPPDQQVDRLKEQYLRLRGTGSEVRARVGALPVRQYVSMLERGYRVSLARENECYVLVLRPDGSTPRLGLRGAHSIACHADGRVYPPSQKATGVNPCMNAKWVPSVALAMEGMLRRVSPDEACGEVPRP